MRGQWNIILGLLVAIIIAIFAVINVEGVRVNYLFGTAEWPLILVILGSVFMGAIVAGALGMVKIYRLQAELKKLKTLKGHQESAVNTGHHKDKVEGDENTVIKDTNLDQDPK